MPVKVEGIISAENMLLRLDSTAKKRVVSVLIKRALEIRNMARKMAPIDDGDLEKAIKTRGTDGGRERSDTGQFLKTRIEVYIDGDVPVEDRPGKTVGDYAYTIHEHVAPAGFMKLGPKSELKQATQSVVVGGAFMDRAVEEVMGAVDTELVDILRDFM